MIDISIFSVVSIRLAFWLNPHLSLVHITSHVVCYNRSFIHHWSSTIDLHHSTVFRTFICFIFIRCASCKIHIRHIPLSQVHCFFIDIDIHLFVCFVHLFIRDSDACAKSRAYCTCIDVFNLPNEKLVPWCWQSISERVDLFRTHRFKIIIIIIEFMAKGNCICQATIPQLHLS